MRARWLPEALQDSEVIFEMIFADNPSAAFRILDKFEQSGQHISRFPHLGRAGRVDGTREFIVSGTPYIIPYRVMEDEVHLLRIYHTSRGWPDSL